MLKITSKGMKAMAVLRVASAVKDTETVVIGPYTFEVDTRDTSHVTGGRIRVDLSGGTTEKAQGTLTMDTQPSATDTVTIGTTVYTWVASGAVAGQINRGASLAAAKTNFVAAVNGSDGINTAHSLVSAAAFDGDTCVITALSGGTGGNAIATTETFTATSNVFDGTTLGTTNAGVDPTADEFTTALAAAWTGKDLLMTKISANEVLLEAALEGPHTAYALSETLSGTNNAWSVSTIKLGQLGVTTVPVCELSRVPTATEVALGTLHFPINFLPKNVLVLVYTTSTGAQVLWNGKIALQTTSPKYRVTLDNSGTTDWSVNETISILIFG